MSEENPKDNINYIYGNNLISQQRNGKELYYYHNNAHGDITHLTDKSGNIANSYDYDAFGNTVHESEKISNSFRYSGQQRDGNGLYYQRARYYNPVTARFTQEDEYLGDGLNLYAYVGNNPVKYGDPSGYSKETQCERKARIMQNIADSRKARESSKFAPKAEAKTLSRENTGISGVEKVPSVKSGKFNEWFNKLTPDELDTMWKDKTIRKAIERELRAPGGMHEWHMVSRAPTFKRMRVSAEQIRELRTSIKDVEFVNPTGAHGKLGSTTAHNEMLGIIDSSIDHNMFTRRLNNWANYRLQGGIDALPKGLRLEW